MKPWRGGEVSSFRCANTLVEGQQINGHTEKRETEERSKERPETQIKEDPSSRSKEEP
jgi:hypothetical protein